MEIPVQGDNLIKSLVQRLAGSVGYEIRRRPTPLHRKCWPAWTGLPLTSFETDDWYHSLYERAQLGTQMEGSDNALRRQRHYTLNHLLWNTLR